MTKTNHSIARHKKLLFVLGLLVLAGAFFSIRQRRLQSASAVTYEFGAVERGDVKSFVSATGTIQPWKVVDVKSNVAGRVDKLFVDLGDQVRAGQLIALIDPTDPQEAVAQARADLLSAQANEAQAATSSAVQPSLSSLSIQQAAANLSSAQQSVSQARQSKRQLEQQLGTLKDVTIPQNRENAQSDLEQAEANLKSGAAEYERQKQLLAKGYTSQSELDAARAKQATLEAAARTARQRAKTIERQNQLAIQGIVAQIAQAQAAIQESQARVREMRAALELARKNNYQVSLKRQQYLAAQAQVRKSQAELRQAATTLGYTRILAPRSGVVVQKNVEQGTVVPSSRASIGSTNALLQIGDSSKVWVVCDVDETDIGQVSVGQRVSVKVDAYPSLIVDGKVIRIDPQAKVEQNVTMIPVTVQIDDPDPRFKPGMNAECDFIVDEVTDVLTVPNEALKEDNGIYSVQQLVDGKVKSVPVEVGVAGPERTEIRSGLREGEQVITRVVEPQKAERTNPLGFSGPGMGRGGGGGGGRGGGR